MIESIRMKITELMTTNFSLSAQLPAFMSMSEGGEGKSGAGHQESLAPLS